MTRYTVEDCGCVRYQDDNDPLPRTIVWCGTATRDIGGLRDSLDRAEVIAEREAPVQHVAPAWEVEPGRTLTYGGVPVFTVTGHTDHRGYRYIPAALDDLTREIAAALNARGIDGKDAIRD